MHATAHKQQACALPPWQHRNADRTCEHGDSRLKQMIKTEARKQRRQTDKREAAL